MSACRSPTMDAERYLDPSAEAIGLPVAPEHRPGVVRYLQLAASMAALVSDFPLGRDDEAANVFVPVAPGDLPGAAS
jgi:hypothetical protein